MSKKQHQIEQEFKDAFREWWDAHGLIDSERAVAWQGWCAAAQALAPETVDLKLQVRQLQAEIAALESCEQSMRTQFDEAINFAIDDTSDGILFLRDWRDGDTSQWPEFKPAQPLPGEQCRDDGRCQYAIDHGAEGLGHCPPGKCCMPSQKLPGEPHAE